MQKKITLISVFLVSLLTQGCIQAMDVKPIVSKLPDIYQASIENNSLTFKAMSNGCTQDQDFEAQIVNSDSSPQWQIIRIKRDLCRMMPFQKIFKIKLPKDNLKLNKLLNTQDKVAIKKHMLHKK